MKKSFLFFTFILFVPVLGMIAQDYTIIQNNVVIDVTGKALDARPVTTAVPFLSISPDARSGAMGDQGVAISPDANAFFWNPAKLAFAEKSLGAAISYTPWLSKLQVKDMFISYLSGYYKLSKLEAIGLGFTYFNMGEIQFTDQNASPIQTFNPAEFSIGLTYSRKLSDHLSIAPAVKYVNSNLAGNLFINNTQTIPGQTVAIDLAAFYTTDFRISTMPSKLNVGLAISNFGPKVAYTSNGQADFMPTMLRLGTALQLDVDQWNKFTFSAEASKLMVPSPPIYAQDSAGNTFVLKGSEGKNKTLFEGVFGSFGDAPDGFSEEMNEIMLSLAAEYWYNDLLAIRAGYFSEHITKGDRKYITLGLGIRYKMMGLDFAYLVPIRQNNPLAETLRFTLHFAMDTQKESKEPPKLSNDNGVE